MPPAAITGNLISFTSSEKAAKLGSVSVPSRLDETPYPELYHRLSQVYRSHQCLVLPATRSHPSLSGINTNNDRLAEPAAGLFNQPGVFYSGCAQDNTLYASFKQLDYCF